MRSDSLWVGAYGDDANGVDSGVAYRFGWDGVRWTLQTTLRPSDSAGGQHFGSDLAAIDGGLFVTAPGDDGRGADAGAV